jgi:nitroimidazol reductase NimA-like FMN-containing flavoprotein (pyridoxamine 5'-phosphate oxidase superfamily)
MPDAANDLVVLSKDDCLRLLTAHRPRLGRIAFVDAGWPMVFPMNYVFDRNLVYFKTAPGSKLFATVRMQQVPSPGSHDGPAKPVSICIGFR